MSRQLEMEAGALITIISKIQRSRRTGLLMTKRLNGSEWEEGSITFVNGQVTGSELGRRKGKEAFNIMSQWKNCRFTFLSPDEHDDALFSSQSKPPPMYQSPSSHGPLPVSPTADERYSLWPNQYLLPTVIPAQRVPFEQAKPTLDHLGSRLYRQIFLLIDGQRSFTELLRIVGRSSSELEKVLHDLEEAGVISIKR